MSSEGAKNVRQWFSWQAPTERQNMNCGQCDAVGDLVVCSVMKHTNTQLYILVQTS